MIHDLKCWPVHYSPLVTGVKTFDVRKNDRGYHTGDTILMREWNPVTGKYTDRMILLEITYILFADGDIKGLETGYVVLAVRRKTNE